jgi:N-acetylglucosaminyldiphosphoundecaprenol N-acetyl-beta-D-mannosaminyltransferase
VATLLVGDLERNVYCILGMPIDAIDMAGVLSRIDSAVARQIPFRISTPNLNFLRDSLSDTEFRESLLDSDLCPTDGMPIVWIARFIGAPIKQRVSGSDIFDALKMPDRCGRQLRVFLFGGAPNVAAAAAKRLNAVPSGLSCVGTLDPGFGPVDEMSQDHIIDEVNAIEADFLAASLGAKKGQLWLHRNHKRFTIPIRAHLGTTINFQAGTVKRAPAWLRACGLEWLWRIREEPYLWRRYANDGGVLLRLIFTRVLPLAIANRWSRFKSQRRSQDLLIKTAHDHDSVTISLSGDATARNIVKAIACFRQTLTKTNKGVVIDLSNSRAIDARFFGLLLMLRKRLKGQGAQLTFVGLAPAMKRMFRLNELGFLLSSE